ncbi:MAG TPA: hypothetical protein VLG67_03555 [Candidatus Saccharimonadales bacterium]|nr:hypothetical protein [Candidatus Saccharimonadales bacterium]
MKKLYRSFLGLLTFASLFIQAKLAYADLCPPGDFQNLCALKADKAGGIIGNIVSGLIILAIALTLIYLVYGGIKYITSGGDKAKVDAARSHIRAAIIGLLISLAAFAILNIITYLFLGQSVTKFKLPTLLD